MMKTWLMRRPVRRPVSRATTAPSSSSVCRLPFISSSASPSRTSSTALAAAAWLCGASTIRVPREIDAGLLRDLLDLRGRTDEDRRDESLLRRLDRAGQRRLLAGVRDRRRDRLEARDSAPAAARTFRFPALGSWRAPLSAPLAAPRPVPPAAPRDPSPSGAAARTMASATPYSSGCERDLVVLELHLGGSAGDAPQDPGEHRAEQGAEGEVQEVDDARGGAARARAGSPP